MPTITLIINPPTHGCMDSSACNYDPDADIDDGVCLQLDECNNCGGNAYAAICASGFPTSITDYTGWTDFWEELVSSAQAITAGCDIPKADWGSCGEPTSYCNTNGRLLLKVDTGEVLYEIRSAQAQKDGDVHDLFSYQKSHI